MKKFRTWYDEKIEEIEIERETEKSVFYKNGDRHLKMCGDFYNHFDTWQEAKDFLIAREQAAIDRALREMQGHQERLEKIREMTP
jgi:hypothetical protein